MSSLFYIIFAVIKRCIEIMYIKVSVKEALRIIDGLIQEGDDLRNYISDDYDRREDEKEIAENDAELQESESENSRIVDKFGSKVGTAFSAMNMLSAQSRSLTEAFEASNSFVLGADVVSDEVIDEYAERYWKWNRKALKELKAVFQHFAPLYKFESNLDFTEFKDLLLGNANYRRFTNLLDRFDSNLRTLVSFYDDFKNSMKSPLVYIDEKSQIWFFDFMCQLKAGSNEAALCSFMFQHGIGEIKEYADIYEYVTGETDKFPKNWEKTIKSSYHGVNLKTNKLFGFPILKKEGLTLALHLPTNFIGSLI